MVLIAASALAFMLIRPVLNGPLLLRGPSWTRQLAIAVALLVTWTPTALWLRLRSPRPRLLRLSRQPDFVASLAATSTMMLALLAMGILGLVRLARAGAFARAKMVPRPSNPDWWLGVIVYFGEFAGVAVIGAWVDLVVSGRHRASRGWLDILGRGIGIAWIVVFVAVTVARLGYLRD